MTVVTQYRSFVNRTPIVAFKGKDDEAAYIIMPGFVIHPHCTHDYQGGLHTVCFRALYKSGEIKGDYWTFLDVDPRQEFPLIEVEAKPESSNELGKN